ncbi:ferrous iron transport protein A [Acidobacteriota bacterium]
MISLLDAPRNKQLKIVEFEGGQSVHRRLLALGFHKNDLIELDSKSIFGGPLLIKDFTTDVSAALGRGIAKKIMVEIVDET